MGSPKVSARATMQSKGAQEESLSQAIPLPSTGTANAGAGQPLSHTVAQDSQEETSAACIPDSSSVQDHQQESLLRQDEQMTDASLFTMSVAAKTNCGQHHFDEDELHAIARETRPFTRDGFAENAGACNPVCLDDACFLPDRPYECTDQRGHHTWLNPPISCLRLALQHHLACKARAPTSTSMCILVPFWRQANFWPLLMGVKCILIQRGLPCSHRSIMMV